MNRTRIVSTLAGALFLGLTGLSQAQTAGQTRSEVKMDRDTFLSMHRFDEQSSQWVLKSDMVMPAGVLPRAEVVAMRDKFLRMHTWNEASSQWIPVGGVPRDMSKLSRAQVKADTERFLKTHRFDEAASNWVAK